MKGIYLGAGRALHSDYDIVYQDINGKRDIGGDMMTINLSLYDYVIATPPCNFWSHACSPDRASQYALDTRHLLPDILDKLRYSNIPYIVENVRNEPRMTLYGVLPRDYCFVYKIGRHTYWSNIMFNAMVQFEFDFTSGGYVVTNNGYRQGGQNVHNAIESWLKEIHRNNYVMLKG